MQAVCDDLLSLLVRFEAANKVGNVGCVTCGIWLAWTMVDAGHFQPRDLKPTRFDRKNVNPQCKDCNGMRRRGEQFKHGVWIDEKWGPGTADELVIKAKLDGSPYNNADYFYSLAHELVNPCLEHDELMSYITKISYRQRAAWVEFFEIERGDK